VNLLDKWVRGQPKQGIVSVQARDGQVGARRNKSNAEAELKLKKGCAAVRNALAQQRERLTVVGKITEPESPLAGWRWG